MDGSNQSETTPEKQVWTGLRDTNSTSSLAWRLAWFSVNGRKLYPYR